MLAAGGLLLAQCGLGGGESADETGTSAALIEAAASPTAPPQSAQPATAPEPTPTAPAAIPTAVEAPAVTAIVQAPPPPASAAPVGPPPVAVGAMPEMSATSGGLAHARFVAEYFSGPVDGFAAASSDTGVATASVRAPDLLIVAPVGDGSATITVTASGPGGAAPQTFTVRVGSGSGGSRVAAAPPAPSPSPAPAPAPSPPPAATEPEVFVPVDELPVLDPAGDSPPPAGEDAASGVPLESLTSDPVTAAPTLWGSVPAQTLIVGESHTLNVRSYFRGVVQGWDVESYAPGIVPAVMTVAGEVTLSGDALGAGTVTVTARNGLGSVTQSFLVAVKTRSAVVLTVVGDSPRLSVAVGQLVALDLRPYFSEAATGFQVTYDRDDPNRLIDVTVSGSVATIRGLRAGSTRISLGASSSTTRITRPATVQVTAN